MFEYKKNPAIKEYVTKNGEKKYWFQIYLGTDSTTGKKKRTSRRGFKTPALANKEYLKLSAQLNNNSLKPNTTADLTFANVYQQWFDNSYKDTVQSSTLYKTKQIFDCHILPEIGDMKINQITSEFLQPIVDQWANKYTKLNIISRYADRVFKYAYTIKIINADPFDHVLLPKRNKHQAINRKPKNNFFSTTELEKFTKYLINNTKSDNSGTIGFTQAVFFIIMAYTGMRKGELLALEWSDINFDQQTIDINKTVVTDENGKQRTQPPKWNSFRVISYNSLIAKYLSEYRKYQSNTTLLFPNHQAGIWRNLGKPNVWLRSIINQGTADFQKIYQMTKDNYYREFVHQITPHGLRHTHATWIFEKNNRITPKAVQQRLGHKNISVTLDIYTHVTSDQDKLLNDTLDIDF